MLLPENSFNFQLVIHPPLHVPRFMFNNEGGRAMMWIVERYDEKAKEWIVEKAIAVWLAAVAAFVS